jgi:hypothetical protein
LYGQSIFCMHGTQLPFIQNCIILFIL